MNPLKTDFLQDFVRTAHDGWLQGWHERNAGNLSYHMAPADVAEVKGALKPKKWHELEGVEVPGLAGECFVVTAAGSFFRNVELAPKECLGIIQIDEEGKRYRQCWGFAKNSNTGEAGRPTSELPAHLLIHEARKAATDGESRVVYHAHPVNAAALTFVLPLTAEALTEALWRTISECAMVFPEGVGVVEWMVPGSVELGRATAQEMERHNAVFWPHHGLICAGATLDLAFGLVHTIDKAAEVYMKARSVQPVFSGYITNENLRALSDAYELGLEI